MAHYIQHLMLFPGDSVAHALGWRSKGLGTGGFPPRLLLRNIPFSQVSKAWQWVAVTCLIKDRDYLAFEMETKTPECLK